jgi:alpha-ribazole phosphatase/probable phosphoglycerate mutase
MVKALYLIRHGETDGAHERRYKGSLDVPLSKLGQKQASATGLRMKEMGLVPDIIYSSPLSRALKSAELIGGHFSLNPHVADGLKERDFGAWEGMSFEEIAERWPGAFSSWAHNPMKFRPVDGESTLEVRERVVPVLEELLHISGVESIAIVAHGGVNRVILCHYTGVPLENIFRMDQGFACLNVIRFHDPASEGAPPLPVLELMNLMPEV